MDSDVKEPLVSVIMPVYNCQSYLKEAVESILNQTYKNFEFIIINDNSQDNSLEIIKSFEDKRFVVLNNTSNQGISYSLNKGVKIAKGSYIARMDADDISCPNRIEKQVRFLEANTKYILCGSNYSIIGENRSIILPENDDEIKLTLLNYCCIAHPTVLLRKKTLDLHQISYSDKMEPAEDYDLWCLLSDKGKFYNIQENLLFYRVHVTQISQKSNKEQRKKAFSVKLKLYTKLCGNINTRDEIVLKKLLLTKEKVIKTDISFFSSFIDKLRVKNNEIVFFNSERFNKYIIDLEDQFLMNYFGKNQRYTIVDFIKYLKINRKFNLSLRSKNKFVLFLKSISFYKI